MPPKPCNVVSSNHRLFLHEAQSFRSRFYRYPANRQLHIGRQPAETSVTGPSARLCLRPRPNPAPGQHRTTVAAAGLSAKDRRPKPIMSSAFHYGRTQSVDAPLTRSATFLVLSLSSTPDAIKTVRATLASISDIAKNVSFRDPAANLSCTVGIGSRIWDSLTGQPRPAELHLFPVVEGAVHTAVSTPGDLLFHIRAERRDISFEFERQLMDLLGDSVSVVDETVGFRYFDARDLLGFVDGTANPVGPGVPESVVVTQADDSSASAAGGSYVVVQKYTHDLKAWGALSTEQQEAIIGRKKLDNIELDDAPEGQQGSHKTLTTIDDGDGDEYDILRDNMPFGSPGSGEFGTYFIGYSRRLWVVERMMQRMFVGEPKGKHDRLLDFSKPLTGTTFFAPTASFLESLDPD